jgi:small nuclear ribonucleoprotein (snRNP)-like protein
MVICKDGDGMNTKEYLGQMRNIDRFIKDKLEEAEKWRAIAENMTGNLNEICVQTTKQPDKMANAVIKLVDLLRESDEEALSLINIKETIIKQIDELYRMGHDKDYMILKSYYVQERSLAYIALDSQYSYKQIKRNYEKAIRRFESIFGDTYLTSD